MIFSTLVDYTHGCSWHTTRSPETRAAKMVVASSMIINLALLGFFKYYDFLAGTVNSLVGSSAPAHRRRAPHRHLILHIQTMSYTIDVYRGDAEPQKNIISFGAYVALFPQLIAGPIVAYKTVADQLNNRVEDTDKFAYGIKRFTAGLGKKVLLANSAGVIWDTIKVMDMSSLPVLTAWIGILAYTFQIYFDFSGYSDMAIGLGNMLGFRFLENFDYPYMSKSITEFWRRWHISLGSWFRDYVYIPLGGNRKGFAKQIRNICVVWL
ncbi:MAG: MBOAT family O-acyltransferase, partial [Eubacteriales bacterium]